MKATNSHLCLVYVYIYIYTLISVDNINNYMITLRQLKQVYILVHYPLYFSTSVTISNFDVG